MGAATFAPVSLTHVEPTLSEKEGSDRKIDKELIKTNKKTDEQSISTGAWKENSARTKKTLRSSHL